MKQVFAAAVVAIAIGGVALAQQAATTPEASAPATAPAADATPAPEPAAGAATGAATGAIDQVAAGHEVFQKYCKECHDPNMSEAPNRDLLAQKHPDEIWNSLTVGVMQGMASDLTDQQKEDLIVFLTKPEAITRYPPRS